MSAARDPRAAKRVETALRAVLPRAASLQVVKKSGSTLELRVAGRRLTAQWVGTGLPSELRAVLAGPRRRAHVLVARELSAGARAMLSGLGIGWVDELGGAEIAAGSLVVSRTGRARTPRVRGVRWTPSALSVAEALLCEAKATVEAMQDVTGLSGGACTYALGTLSKLGFLRSSAARGRESGRHVIDRDKLLDSYASEVPALDASATLVVGVTWRDVVTGLAELGARWTSADLAWAATGLAAAAVVAPLVTTLGSAVVYVDATSRLELELIARRFELRPIEGGRLTLAAFPTTSTRRLARTVAGLRVAPWPRLYADLRTTGVRGEEAAEHLREVVDGR